MKLNKNIYGYSFSILMLAFATSGFAQTGSEEKDKKTETGSTPGITEEIEVVRPYKPVLADASKIRRSPDLNSKKPFKPTLSYNVLDNRLELNSDIKQLQAQQLVAEQRAALRNNLVKIGVGNLNTGLGEIYINNGNDEALQAGFFLKHLNQEGSINGQKISQQEAAVFGRSIMDAITLNGELGFDRLRTNFYGVTPGNLDPDADVEKQRFSTISLKGELLKNQSENNEAEFNYAAKADLYLLRSYDEGKENSFAISAFLNKAWNQFNFGVNTSADFTKTRDAAYDIANNLFRVNPYIKFQGANYKLILGLNLVQEFGTDSRTNLLPAVSAEFPVVPGYATIFGGFTGDVLKSSLRNFSNENPYLMNNIGIANAVEKSNIYGGVRGNGGAGFGFKAAVFFKSIQDMPLFVNNPTDPRKFDVIYDDGNSKIVGFEGEVSVNASETFTWTGKINMNNYKMSTEKEAWHKPDFRLISNARLSVNNKVAVDAEVVLNGQSQAKIFAALEESQVSIKSFVDFSAGAEYRFREKVGLYLRVNNMFGNGYQQYLYYPKFGLNVLGGFNYSF